MNALRRTQDDFYDLLDDLCDGSLSKSDADRLDQILRHDRDARQQYLSYLEVHAGLGLITGQIPPEGMEFQGQATESDPQSPIFDSSYIPPIVVHAPPTLQSSPFTLRSPLGSFMFSHIAAAVILGIGLLIGLAWRISLPSSEGPAPDNNIAQVVGRITALADCAWSKQGSEVRGPGSGISEIEIPKSPNPQIPVFLGDRFVLSSGLMEITYGTGARVILQGPCTYEIDSERSGYLAVGKLTAKVEKGSGARGPGSGNANPAPLSSLPSPLFAVRTPTAVVTDLGTEFGVEVEKSGATRSHVFQGSVELRASNSLQSKTSSMPTEILRVGQSARVEWDRNHRAIIAREASQSDHFVRHIPPSSINHPTSRGPTTPVSASSRTQTGHSRMPSWNVASSTDAYAKYVLSLKPAVYYRMERSKSDKTPFVIADSATGGHHGTLHLKGSSVASYGVGRFGDAIILRGGNTGDFISVPHYPATTGGLTVVAWVMALEGPWWPSAFTTGELNEDGTGCLGFHFGLRGLDKEVSHCVLGRTGENVPMKRSAAPRSSAQPLHRWHHVACVIDQDTVRLYRNGKEVTSHTYAELWPVLSQVREGSDATSVRIDKALVSLNSVVPCRMDEVAVFNEALSARTIERLYLGGATIEKERVP